MTKIYNFLNLSGIAETVEMVQEAGGYCKGYVVDIAKKEEVYKAADVIRAEVGDVSSAKRNIESERKRGAGAGHFWCDN